MGNKNEQRLFWCKKLFNSNSKDFCSFQDVKPNVLEKIKKILDEKFPLKKYPYKSVRRYFAVMEFLNSSKKSKFLNSFDEKIIFLIQALDPNLYIYFYYLGLGYSKHDDIYTSFQKEKSLIDFIEYQLGAFDANLLKYEEIYFKRFLKSSEIQSYVNTDFSSSFLNLLPTIKSFEDVSSSTFSYISSKANYYLSKCKNPNSINTVCFNLSNPNSEVQLYYFSYKVIFFILVIDPDLKALRISFDESKVSDIKRRMIEELGFYNEDFIRVEKLYRKQFFLGMRVSEWEDISSLKIVNE